jgi:hypothetical protein
MEDVRAKNEQRHLSKTLVTSFKNCIDQVLRDKEQRMQ